jgi:hypothetical protein
LLDEIGKSHYSRACRQHIKLAKRASVQTAQKCQRLSRISIITQLTSQSASSFEQPVIVMSEPAAKAAATSSTERRSLENEAILRQVLLLLIGQGVFVRTVAQDV